ncbi:unnamed protein product [Paramecium octaurelia]|uniref:Uncharacterized protein n=1 Tax=Paramecium octaurelia TaxID=43137 RepID=A0A8S1YQH3_PAROT|nr:unnamed protein product [Paramecium octaurelia]CAD8214302.1 unnamed protein product [Paramecium octaurelia]
MTMKHLASHVEPQLLTEKEETFSLILPRDFYYFQHFFAQINQNPQLNQSSNNQGSYDLNL